MPCYLASYWSYFTLPRTNKHRFYQRSPYFTPSPQSTVHVLYLVHILYPVPSPCSKLTGCFRLCSRWVSGHFVKKKPPNWGIAKGVEIGRSFILIPTPWALMSHPHWPIFPSAFVEKTTNAKDGKDCYTVSEANVVSKECCFAFTNCTVLYYFLSLYPLMADAFPRRFSHRREKRVSGGGGRGGGWKRSLNCVFSLITLLSNSIQKV